MEEEKTNLIMYTWKPYKNETQGQARQLRLICHPKLKIKIGAWGFKWEEGNSGQEEEQIFGN